MNFALEEAAVDTFVAYLGKNLSGGARAYASPTERNIEYPACVIRVAAMMPVQEGLSWSIYQKLHIEIAAISEMADEIDNDANVIEKVRMLHAMLRSSILTALSISDSAATPDGLADLFNAQDLPRGLAAELTAVRAPGVVITSAQPMFPLAEMDIDEEHRAMITKINVEVIAQAIEN